MKNRGGILKIIYLLACLAGTTSLYAEISLDSYGFSAVTPTLNINSNLTYVSPTSNTLLVSSVPVTSNTIALNTEPDSNAPPMFTGKLLNYPNPFSMAHGTQIGYRLTGAMTIDLKIYTLTGYEVFRKTFRDSEEGGLAQYNHVPINLNTLNGATLSPGTYIYTISNEGKLLARNRMVVKP